MSGSKFLDRSVFITGGASGIGRATALAFAAEGARITIADVNETDGEAVAENIRDKGGKAIFVYTDATNEGSTKQAIEMACSAHGPIRHAFNNVGGPKGGSLEDTSLEDWDWTLRLSLTSVFVGMKYQCPVMRERGGGTIVNTASNTAGIIMASVPAGYSAAKAAVIHLSRYGSVVLAKDNIRVNSVSPGLTATPLIFNRMPPERRQRVTDNTQLFSRMVQPEEIAAGVLYLSSDEAAMVTGQDLEIGGGRRS